MKIEPFSKVFVYLYILASELMDKEFDSMVSAHKRKASTNGTSKDHDE